MTRRDLALIAAAVHYAKLQKEASLDHQPAKPGYTRWKMSGRTALFGAESVIADRSEERSR